MKKLILVLLLINSVYFAQSFERNLLIEVFTNSHCGLCPGTHGTLDAYLATGDNADKVNVIYYHMSFPYSDDPLHLANPTDASARNQYYGPFSSTPRSFFDGQPQSNSYSQWPNTINGKVSVMTSVNIALSGSKENDKVQLNIDVTFGGGVNYGESTLHIIAIEDVMYQGRNGISDHKNVMRQMLAGSSGESIQTNGTQSISRDYTLNSEWNTDNLSFLVFVQNISTKEVFQSAIIDYSELVITSVSDENNSGQLPDQFNLAQNYPNPFNPTTTIQYSIPRAAAGGSESQNVTLKVYDVLGNEIATLVNEQKSSGNYSVSFDAASLNTGVYFYTLTSGTQTITRKMILMK
jgi:hypothetical protein